MSPSRKFVTVAFLTIAWFSNGFAQSVSEDEPKSLTELFESHWHYKAFWAIPEINTINPRLALKTNSEGMIIGRSRCLEIDNLEQRRINDPLAKMKNEQLHRVACKSMKLAIKNIDYLPIFEKLDSNEEILIKFNFSKGVVSSSKRLIEPDIVDPGKIDNSG